MYIFIEKLCGNQLQTFHKKQLSCPELDFFGLFFPPKKESQTYCPQSQSSDKAKKYKDGRSSGKREKSTKNTQLQGKAKGEGMEEEEQPGRGRERGRERKSESAVHRGAATRSHVSTIERGRSGTPDTPHPSFPSSLPPSFPLLLFHLVAPPPTSNITGLGILVHLEPQMCNMRAVCNFSKRCISLRRHACLSTGGGTRFTGCARRNCSRGLSTTPTRQKQRQRRRK